MQTVIIILLALLIYAWILYPFLLAILSRGKVWRKGNVISNEIPASVTILLSAYNEEKMIRRRLENLTVINIPHAVSRIMIFVGIDGSTDKTAEIARDFASTHDNIHVVEFKERRGKVAVLKELVRKSQEENNRTLIHPPALVSGQTGINADESSNSLLIFTDANTMFRPDTIDKLLSHFSNPEVGGVCGQLEFRENVVPSPGLPVSSFPCWPSPSEGFYWRWETQLKTMESSIDSCLGANGAIYAIRSDLFWKDIPDNTVVDDFVIGMKVREQGFRMIYEPCALAEEEFPAAGAEWQRRIRIGAGDYQALILCRKCLMPRYGEFAYMFWSHKVLRWFTPHIMMILFSVSLLAIIKYGWFYGKCLPLVLLIGMAGLIFSSLFVRMLSPSASPISYFFRLCNYFLVMNIALIAGSFRFFRGDLKGYWERTVR
ncbi:MAG: glycosyltransferase family 2 protein [Kiritimatiellae bacterium]|nr:glycosyltransferase family 2 protein [Kiritimatiellia bacterium]MDD5521911.1 glycosyltransferase family 2 protein [Kiritimatiellia bacterium]